LYDCVICGTLECSKHVYFWKIYGEELCDYQIQMC
jgi:hypothetical protein